MEGSQHEQMIDFYAKLFYTNFQVETKDQLSNMLYACRNFCNCFKDTEKEIAKLQSIYAHPIKFVLENFKEHFSDKQASRMLMKKTVSQLEWIYFRDTRRFTSLRKEYFMDDNKPQRSRHLTLADIIALRGFIKMAVGDVFTEVAIKNSVSLNPMLLPTLMNAPIQQVGVEDFEN